MENTTVKQIQTDKITHSFYCDECGEHLGDSVEYDDGYYEEFGEFEQKICINSQWYKVRKNLCEKHRAEFTNKIITALTDLGFEMDKSYWISTPAAGESDEKV